ncbi:hypothetical protein H0H81_007831 [Sphagnurus paluster]|uniref:Cytochrome c oxidase assembly protein COX20, mitochondrial n=1 Tax=Sphagnurus paluster TaxID=117069 RepID=A0A9P7FQ79_9AGAR|nr:hypothetical protein H0H81_007831 [Sphagnurus paluster]
MSESTPLPGANASSIPPPPSKAPPATGNFLHDVFQSVTHISDVPCARNSLLGGIASGAGIGVVRGMSASALVAGNWAMATFVLISLGSLYVATLLFRASTSLTSILIPSSHLCQKQMADERRKVTQVIESMPQRRLVVKEDSTGPAETSAAGASGSSIA